MKQLLRLFPLVHLILALMFAGAALALIGIAGHVGWKSLVQGWDAAAAQSLIEAVGLLAAAVVALQIAETIIEEEVIREADISAPTRVRRFVSRFFVVIVVALGVEGLVATFKALHEDIDQLPAAAALLVATAALLAAWGVFVHLNRSAEELEPEAMVEAKEEDQDVKG